MEITLRHLTDKSGTSVLSVKRDLVEYKSKGLIFYLGSVLDFQMDDSFDLYFAYKATVTDRKIAFPVSETVFRRYSDHQAQLIYLRLNFERYFEMDSTELTDEFFTAMSTFRGEKFTWYYLRNGLT